MKTNKYNWNQDNLAELLNNLLFFLKIEKKPSELLKIIVDINNLIEWFIEENPYYIDKFKIYEKINDAINVNINHLKNGKREILANCNELCYLLLNFNPNNTTKDNLCQKYEYEKILVQENSFLIPTYKDYQETTEFISYPRKIKNISLSKDDLLALTHDFYKSLNSYFFHYFYKTFKDRYHNFRFNNEENNEHDGYTLIYEYLNKIYINVTRYGNIGDFVTTVHEYAHATSYQINSEHTLYNKILLNEADSIFLELLATDYYYKITNDASALNLKNNSHLIYSEYINDIISFYELVQMENKLQRNFKNKKEIIKNWQEINYFPFNLYNILNNHQYEYAFSYILALELYNLYQNDKDKALDTLKKLIELKCHNSKEYYVNVKKLGLIPNLNLLTYERELQRELKQSHTIK